MKRTQIFFILILFFSAIFRLWGLGKIPEGFHADEAAFGYNAYSILMTGKDEHGVVLPLMLNIFGISIGAVYSYITIPFIYFFGLNEWAVRIPTALAGIAFIIVIYALIRHLTRNNILAFFTAGVFGISPTSIFLSRVQSDPLVANLFLHTGLLLYLLYVQSNKMRHFLFSCVFLGLALFTHQATYALAPLFLGLLLCYKLRESHVGKRVMSVLLLIIVFTISFWSYAQSANRISQLSFIMSPQVTIPLSASLSEDGVAKYPVLLSRVFHNKLFQHTQSIIESVGKYWSFDFLFIQAKQPMRESVEGMGFFYLLEFPLLIYGFYQSVRRYRSLSIVFMTWLLLGTIAVSTALDESPGIHRFYYISIPLYFYISVGIYSLLSKKIYIFRKQIFIWPILLIGYLISIIMFLHQLFIHQPTHQPYYRGYAYKEFVGKILSLQNKYKLIIFTKSQSSPYIYYLFYSHYNPLVYQSIGSPRDFEGSKIDNIMYSESACPFTAPEYQQYRTVENSVLFINRGDCGLTINANVIDTIRWRDTLRAFQLVTYISTESAKKTK